MAAAKHQRTGAVKRIHHRERRSCTVCGGRHGHRPRQHHQQGGEHCQQRQPPATRKRDSPGVPRVGYRTRHRISLLAAPGPPPHQACPQHSSQLAHYTRLHQGNGTGGQHQRRPPHRGTQPARHAPHRLGHHSHGHHLEALHQPCRHAKPARRKPQAQQCQCQGRWQRETHPGRQRTAPATTHQAQRHTHLAAGGARQELAQRHQVCVAVLREPTAAHHKLITEIAQVGHRPAKRGQPQAQEHPEHLPGSGRCNGGRRRTWCDRHGA